MTLGTQSISSLRQHLSRITEQEPVDDHPALIAELRATLGHSINLQESSLPIDQYTCVVYALHLAGNQKYYDIASSRFAFAGKEFINSLLTNNLLALRELKDDVSPNDLVIYFDKGEFRHVGLMLDDHNRVLSKWGTGCLFKHDIWEVPESYGNELRYYAGTNEEASIALFQKYASRRI